MDTLTTPVLLRCMVTNSKKAGVSIVAGTMLFIFFIEILGNPELYNN
jgi:hypothetical protein